MKPISRSIFDISICALLAAEGVTNWKPKHALTSKLLWGFNSFALFYGADQLYRHIFLKNVLKQEPPPLSSMLNVLIEEGAYSIILRTENMRWMIPRFVFSSVPGMTAARTFCKQKGNDSGLTTDTIAGLFWGIAREGLLQTLPKKISLPVLVLADSVSFALCEVCPKKDDPYPLPIYSSAWFYKSISGGIFRLIANITTIKDGAISAIAMHTLYNLSCYLPVRTS